MQEGCEGDGPELMACPGHREQVVDVEEAHDVKDDLDGETIKGRSRPPPPRGGGEEEGDG